MNNEVDVILVTGTFDYGDSVSGSYILYKILKQIPNLKLKVLPFFTETVHPVDNEDFLTDTSLDSLPPHKILFATGDDLDESTITQICKKHKSKFLLITMTHWMYSNTKVSFPELNNEDLYGQHIEARLSTYKEIGAEIICGSTHSYNVHKNSMLRELPIHVIPLPFEEIEVDETVYQRDNKKAILWGTTQPETPRKGKHYLESILDKLYTLSPNPEDIQLVVVGPSTSINTKFDIEYKGVINNRKELSKIYKTADVFALTTLADAGPMMAVECLKNGTPIVAFPYNIANDIVKDGKNGYVVEDVDEYANKLYDIIYSKKFHIDYEYVKNFNTESVVVQKYISLFKKMGI
jgi:glycosyltransferase involved in cell wall biosynthesis